LVAEGLASIEGRVELGAVGQSAQVVDDHPVTLLDGLALGLVEVNDDELIVVVVDIDGVVDADELGAAVTTDFPGGVALGVIADIADADGLAVECDGAGHLDRPAPVVGVGRG